MTYLKADLHQHLEAAGSYDIYKQFADEAGIEIATDFTPEGFTFTSLPEFFKAYDYINEQLIRSADQYYRLTKDYLQRMLADHVVYCDLMFSPAHGVISGVEYPQLMQALTQAIEEMEAEGIFATLSLTTVRGEGEHYGPDHAARWARVVKERKAQDEDRYITSFGLAGNEHYGQFGDFKEAFAIAHEAGLVLRAHAGEGTSAAVIADAIRELKIQVIDHGTRLIDDAALLAEVANQKLGITVIPTSNLLLNVHTEGAASHPLWKMRENGIALGIGGDDNYFFNTDISKEYAVIQQAGGLSDAAMQQWTASAIRFPLVPEWMQNRILKAYPELEK